MTDLWIGVSRSVPSFPLTGNGSALRSGGTQTAHLTLLLCVLVARVPPLACRAKGLPQGTGSGQGQGWQVGGQAGPEQQRGEAGAQEPMVGGRRQEEAGLHREVAPSPWEMLLPT